MRRKGQRRGWPACSGSNASLPGPPRRERGRASGCPARASRSGGRPPEGARWIYVADRESDFYEPLQLCRGHGVDFIIRACHDRRLAEGGHMRDAVAAAPALGRSGVELRSRPGQAGRVAEVEVRAARVDLDGPWRPGGWQPPLPGVTVVEVRETAPPAEVKEPLRWLHLTSLPCGSAQEALRVAGRYCRRWWIEEYHKALKSGAGVESSQLREGFRLEPLIAILAVVAVRLLAMKLEARSQEAGAALGEEARLILERNYGLPPGGWTSQSLLVAVARLGGFLARKGDGQPGWNKLFWMSQGLEFLKSSPPPSA